MHEPVIWLDDSSPFNPRFGDRYRSRAGGLAQAQSVFLAGCGLPDNWQDKNQFTVLETGFGLGLNFLATWANWTLDAQRCEHLHFVSIEAHPVESADILRNAQTSDPKNSIDPKLLTCVAALAPELVHAWDSLVPGINTLSFADNKVTLTLAIGDVQSMLARLDCVADAVYLDGFSPAVNPQMWSYATLQAVAALCHADTALSSYSVALSVRESLTQLGFQVQKCKGLAPKRHRLQARRLL